MRLLRHESVTKVHPAASSALPISIMALSKVCPWLLCIVMAYRSWRGSCWRGSCRSLDSHSNFSGGTGTQFGLLLRNGGSAEWSKSTVQQWESVVVCDQLVQQLVNCTSSTITKTNLLPNVGSQHDTSMSGNKKNNRVQASSIVGVC